MVLRSVKRDNLPKHHVDVLEHKASEYYSVEKLCIPNGNIGDYEVLHKLGRGRYSMVFAGRHKPSNKRVAIKILKPISMKLVKREIKILQNLAGGQHIVPLLDVAINEKTKAPCLVFEYFSGSNCKLVYPTLTLDDVRYYISELLQALDFIHSRGIIHRDVKPGNIVIDHNERKLSLIDWGVAQFYFPMREYELKVGSRHYKGPELLVGDSIYDYSLDVWGAGCVMAGMIFLREPLFTGVDDSDQLVKIVDVLGSDKLQTYLDTYGLDLKPDIKERVANYPGRTWTSFVDDVNRDKSECPDALDLIDNLLRFDPSTRTLPCEALGHSFFCGDDRDLL